MSDRHFSGEAAEVMFYDYGWKVKWEFKTDTSNTIGGYEQRRARWTYPIRSYTVTYNSKTLTNLNVLRQFFFDHQGSYDSFLFYDPNSRMTWTIPTGSKVTSGTAVTKVYLPFRNVKPLNTTPTFGTDIRVYVSGTERTDNMTVDQTAGSISFTTTYATSTQKIEVNYEYYTRVRFNQDTIESTEKTYNLQDVSIELIEVR